MSIRPLSSKTLLSLSSSSFSHPISIFISHFSSSPSHPSHSSYSSRRFEEESRNVRVSVWWDFENCNLPAGVNVFKVAQRITAAVRASGIKGPITIAAFGDVLQLSRANQEALSSTGINLTHVPNGGKNSADRSLLVDLTYWVSQNPPPAHLFLISGDRDFASILHRLRMNNYNILLASPGSAPGVLCSAASIMWHWHALIRGENLSGKHFNQPPDGPYGSWYGHYKEPLEDPFALVDQPASLQTEELSDPDSDSKLRPVPKAVVKQIRQILSSYPEGISITELRAELSRSTVSIDKDFYGYKKFSRFLLAMRNILKLKSVGDGQFIICGITTRAPEPLEASSGISTGLVARNGDPDLSVSSRVNGDDRSVNIAMERKSDSYPSAEAEVEEPLKGLQQTSPSNKIVKSQVEKPQRTVEEPLLIDGKDIEAASALVGNGEQDSAYEMGIFKKIWKLWFGDSHDSSEVRTRSILEERTSNAGDVSERKSLNITRKCGDSGNSSEKVEVGGKCAEPLGQSADPVRPLPCSSNHSESAGDGKTNIKVSVNKSGTNQGFFSQILNRCKFWKSNPEADELSDQSSETRNNITSHSQKSELFMQETFWKDMESFMDSIKASLLISQSRTREQMAENLQEEGPLPLKDLTHVDVLHLVDLLISEKKWVEECPSQASPFRIAQPSVKGSGLGHSCATNGLRSIFLGTRSQSDFQGEHDGKKEVQDISQAGVSESVVNRKPSDRSRSEILVDCQNLVKEIQKAYPQGYNLGSFRRIFLQRYGYPLDIQKLGYQKLTSLLQIMPGVRIESTFILPSSMATDDSGSETAFPNLQEHTGSHAIGNSDGELSNTPMRQDDLDSPWEELGPVSSGTSSRKELKSAVGRRVDETKRKPIPDYEPSLSDDDFSEQEGETSLVKQTEGKKKPGINEEDSSLLQILDSWYSSKESDDKKEKPEDIDGIFDADGSKSSFLPGVGSRDETSLGSCGRKQRVQRSYSFVADSVDTNKNKLIDGILGSLKKSNESRMQG